MVVKKKSQKGKTDGYTGATKKLPPKQTPPKKSAPKKNPPKKSTK